MKFHPLLVPLLLLLPVLFLVGVLVLVALVPPQQGGVARQMMRLALCGPAPPPMRTPRSARVPSPF